MINKMDVSLNTPNHGITEVRKKPPRPSSPTFSAALVKRVVIHSVLVRFLYWKEPVLHSGAEKEREILPLRCSNTG